MKTFYLGRWLGACHELLGLVEKPADEPEHRASSPSPPAVAGGEGAGRGGADPSKQPVQKSPTKHAPRAPTSSCRGRQSNASAEAYNPFPLSANSAPHTNLGQRPRCLSIQTKGLKARLIPFIDLLRNLSPSPAGTKANSTAIHRSGPIGK